MAYVACTHKKNAKSTNYGEGERERERERRRLDLFLTERFFNLILYI